MNRISRTGTQRNKHYFIEKKGINTMKKLLAVLMTLAITATCFITTFALDVQAQDDQCTITYNINTTDRRLSGTESIHIAESSEPTEIQDGPSRPGYTFLEWNTLPDGNGESMNPGDEVLLSESVTLYALWTREESSPIANMYLCATAGSLTGHVWLYFENLSDDDIQVGYVTLSAGEATSVGSLRNTRKDGGGTYYNAEAYMAARKSSVTNSTISLKMELNEAQLSTVSEKIKGMNSYNILWWNCGNFAVRVWNSVSKHKFVHICFPVITIMEMILHGGRFGAVKMDEPEITRCFKQISSGIREADAKSFNGSCV